MRGKSTDKSFWLFSCQIMQVENLKKKLFYSSISDV